MIELLFLLILLMNVLLCLISVLVKGVLGFVKFFIIVLFIMVGLWLIVWRI